ncbi:MAG: hypothetical protein WCW65_01010 [Candidatus Paceibacterota bacterium]
MKKVLIVQSIPEWLGFFKTAIAKEFPLLKDEDVIYTGSFDEAVDIAPTGCELVVISSDMFHDKSSPYRELHGEIIPDEEKNGTKLAEIIKALNPDCKFFVFSQFEPEKSRLGLVDGFIPKNQFGNMYMEDMRKALEKISSFLLQEQESSTLLSMEDLHERVPATHFSQQ